MIDLLRVASVLAWIFCLVCLAPAVWCIARRCARSLDAIWGLVALLVLNRFSFISGVSAEVSYATAIPLAIGMGLLSRSYQRHDR